MGHITKSRSLEYQYEILPRIIYNGTHIHNYKIACGAQAIVDEKFRSNGLTSQMLQLLIEKVKNKYDYIFSSITKINRNAYSVHEKAGYILVGEDENKAFVLLNISHDNSG